MSGEIRPVSSLSAAQRATLDRLQADVTEQLAAKPRRLAHSLAVADTAEQLALTYGADAFLARCAGLLHDWEKASSAEEQLARARELGLDFGVELELVQPLLHGAIAARTLPARYPELPSEVWSAIAVHTVAAVRMSPLDMVLFVADGIEPLRPASRGITHTRSLVGRVTLDDLFWDSFVGGMTYVLEGGRYLYPGTLETYNTLARERAARGR